MQSIGRQNSRKTIKGLKHWVWGAHDEDWQGVPGGGGWQVSPVAQSLSLLQWPALPVASCCCRKAHLDEQVPAVLVVSTPPEQVEPESCTQHAGSTC